VASAAINRDKGLFAWNIDAFVIGALVANMQ